MEPAAIDELKRLADLFEKYNRKLQAREIRNLVESFEINELERSNARNAMSLNDHREAS